MNKVVFAALIATGAVGYGITRNLKKEGKTVPSPNIFAALGVAGVVGTLYCLVAKKA